MPFFARVDEQHRQPLVNQRVRSVLHLARRIAFGVNVGNLFQLQSAFESDREIDSAPEVEKIGRAEKLLRQFFDLVRLVQQVLDLDRQFGQLLRVMLCFVASRVFRAVGRDTARTR